MIKINQKKMGLVNVLFDQLCLEFKSILLDQLENYLDYVKDQAESIFERIINK